MAVPLTSIADQAKWIWRNGKIIPGSDATTHTLGYTNQYSGLIFEGIRVYGGNILLLRPHVERLFDGAKQHYTEIPYSVDQIVQACEETVVRNGLADCYIRPSVFRGPEDIFVGGKDCSINVDIAVFPLPVPPGPKRLKIATIRRAPASALPTGTKSSEMFAAGQIGKREIMEDGFDDALFLDTDSYIADTSAANIFFVLDGKLHTPRPDSILPGITQKVIFKLAALRGYEVVVRQMTRDDLKSADEAFICGTALEVHPVTEIGRRTVTENDSDPVTAIGDVTYKEGPVTAALIADYNELVRKSPAEVDRILGLKDGMGL
jgi:branched-chain amino acid aminotransferase